MRLIESQKEELTSSPFSHPPPFFWKVALNEIAEEEEDVTDLLVAQGRGKTSLSLTRLSKKLSACHPPMDISLLTSQSFTKTILKTEEEFIGIAFLNPFFGVAPFKVH